MITRDMAPRPAAVLLVCSMLVACSHHAQRSLDERIDATVKAAGREAEASGYREQARMMADGVVTQAEYDKAWDEYRSCLARMDVRMDDPKVSPIDGVRKFAATHVNHKVNENEFEHCQSSTVGLVEAAFAERPRPMAEPLRRAVARCLRHRGYSVSSQARGLRELERIVTPTHVEDLLNCVSDRAFDLYGDQTAGFAPPTDL